MTYNADGQRVAKQSTNAAVTGFLYDHKKLLHETDAADNILKTYTTTTDDEFGDLISETGEHYHQYDAQANTNALLDDTPAIDAQYKYFAFGEVFAVSLAGGGWTQENWSSLPLALSSDMLAGGKKQYYLDMETALYLLGTGTNGRYYDPATARFMSEDPIRHASGDPNLFTYVQNDPVNKLDPSGRQDLNQHDDEAKRKQIATATMPSSHATSGAGDHPTAASATTQPATTKSAATRPADTGRGATLDQMEFPHQYDVLLKRSIFQRGPAPPPNPTFPSATRPSDLPPDLARLYHKGEILEPEPVPQPRHGPHGPFRTNEAQKRWLDDAQPGRSGKEFIRLR